MRAALVGAVLVFAAGCGGPGADWTHAELVEHLNVKGYRCRFVLLSGGAGVLPPTGFLVPPDSKATTWREAESEHGRGKGGVVKCVLHKSAQAARDSAGAQGGFAYGRFTFDTRDEEARRRLRAALP